MKLHFNKKSLKRLDNADNTLKREHTPQVAGAGYVSYYACWTEQKQYCMTWDAGCYTQNRCI